MSQLTSKTSRARDFVRRWIPVALGIVLLLVSVPAPDALGSDDALQLRFSRLNRSYSGVVDQMVPVEQGGVGLKLRAPNHRLTIRDHQVDFQRRADGLHAVTVSVDFLGLAHVIAELDVAGATQSIEDDVTVPLQSKTVEVIASFEAVPEGFLITLSELPRSVAVDIESEMGRGIVSWCDSLLGLLGFECSPLEALFSKAIVPMPEAGSVFLLEREELTSDELERLSDYLSAG